MSDRKPTYIRLDKEKKERLNIALMIMGIPSYQKFFEDYVDQIIHKYKDQIEMMEKIKNEGKQSP